LLRPEESPKSSLYRNLCRDTEALLPTTLHAKADLDEVTVFGPRLQKGVRGHKPVGQL
jgi:hypothetical protein